MSNSPDEIRKTIGNRIEAARKAQNLTQKELGVRLGKSAKVISTYETGQRTISVSELPDLARVLAVPVHYFFDDEQQKADSSVSELNIEINIRPKSSNLLSTRLALAIVKALMRADQQNGDIDNTIENIRVTFKDPIMFKDSFQMSLLVLAQFDGDKPYREIEQQLQVILGVRNLERIDSAETRMIDQLEGQWPY